MRILITSVSGFGHLCPVIPLAIALRDAGHNVAFATSASMQPLLDDAKIASLPSGPLWLESDFSHTLANTQAIAGFRNDLSAHLDKTVMPALLSDVFAHASAWAPDVIMSNDFEISGRVVAEKLAIPFVLLSSGPRLPQQLRNQWHGPLFLKARELAELPMANPLAYSLKWLHLCFTPEWYAFQSATLYQAANVEYGIRPAVFDGSSQWKLAPPPQNVGSGTNILCTLGTVFDKDIRILERIIEGAAGHADNLWITHNSGAPKISSSALPDNVRIVTGAQLSTLIPRIDICISHGGTSTLTTALINGVRNLIIPQGADQVMNAIVCSQHRLAVSLMNTVVYDENPDQGRIGLSPSLVSEALSQLKEPSYQEPLAHFQESISRLPDMDCAVQLIEKLAGTGKPVIKA